MGKKDVKLVGENTVEFLMTVKRDSFSPEHDIPVTVDVTNMTREDMLGNCFSGSTMRVRLQSKLRKETEATLERYAREGYKCDWDSIADRAAVNAMDALMKLSRDEFVEQIVDNFGVTEEQANEMYNRKHGLEEGTR